MPGNELHTLGFFAVVQQQAISFVAVTASPAHKGVDFYPIFSTMCAGEKYPLDGRSLSIPYETGTAEERGFSRLYCSLLR